MLRERESILNSRKFLVEWFYNWSEENYLGREANTRFGSSVKLAIQLMQWGTFWKK